MATRYRIFAYSPSQHQRQQYVDLINDTMLESASYAQQHAVSYAQRLNSSFFMHTNDWQPSIEAYDYTGNEVNLNNL